VRPQRIGNELYFMQRAGKKMRAMAYKFDSDSFGAPDLSVFGDHLTSAGVVDMAYQQEPNSVLWVVMADGSLRSVTIERDQDVVAWARHDVGGAVESVACVPAEGRDDVYLAVRREINGESVRYIERMNGTAGMDASITGEQETPTDTWDGLDHLEGEDVLVRADGSLLPVVRVTGGQVVLQKPASVVEIGLPFTPRVEMLTPEMMAQTGSAQGNSIRVGEVSLRVHETRGAKVNGDFLPFRSMSSTLDEALPVFSGIKRIEALGWARGESSLVIEGLPGEPFHLLAVIRKLQVND
jgi:hypothetical protein